MAEGTTFNYSNLDWDAYIRHRPVYPPALYSLIYGHHDTHKGPYRRALDIGAGAGIVSAELAKKFDHVTVSDPSSKYISAAKSLLTKTNPAQSFDFLQTKVEDLTPDMLPDGDKVDLVTAAECVHWMDPSVAIPRMASVLQPNGTCAIWLYGTRPILDEGEAWSEARELFYAIYDAVMKKASSLISASNPFPVATTNARLNNLPVPSSTWSSVRRFHNNLSHPLLGIGYESGASKVTSDESVEHFEDEKLLYVEADGEWLVGYLTHLLPLVKVSDVAAEDAEKLKVVLRGKKIPVRWGVALVLATRK